jgi:hypothetical protein
MTRGSIREIEEQLTAFADHERPGSPFRGPALFAKVAPFCRNRPRR